MRILVVCLSILSDARVGWHFGTAGIYEGIDLNELKYKGVANLRRQNFMLFINQRSTLLFGYYVFDTATANIAYCISAMVDTQL